MNHMNDDHEDSLIAYVLAFATGVEPSGEEEGPVMDGEFAVADGGGCCSLENMQALCRAKCHKLKTAAERARRGA